MKTRVITKWLGRAASLAGVLFAAVAIVAAAPPSAHAVGVDMMGLFELDGNAANNGFADDWEDVANGTDSALVTTTGDLGGRNNFV